MASSHLPTDSSFKTRTPKIVLPCNSNLRILQRSKARLNWKVSWFMLDSSVYMIWKWFQEVSIQKLWNYALTTKSIINYLTIKKLSTKFELSSHVELWVWFRDGGTKWKTRLQIFIVTLFALIETYILWVVNFSSQNLVAIVFKVCRTLYPAFIRISTTKGFWWLNKISKNSS